MTKPGYWECDTISVISVCGTEGPQGTNKTRQATRPSFSSSTKDAVQGTCLLWRRDCSAGFAASILNPSLLAAEKIWEDEAKIEPLGSCQMAESVDCSGHRQILRATTYRTFVDQEKAIQLHCKESKWATGKPPRNLSPSPSTLWRSLTTLLN